MEGEELTDSERRETIQQLIKAMEETEMPPEYVHAAKKTGRIVLEDNIHAYSSVQLDEWNEVVEEGRRIAGSRRRCRSK